MKTVLITGGARGIGRACSELFLKKGYNVVINYKSSLKGANELCKLFPKTSMAIRADVANSKEVSDMFKKIRERFSSVDILINNAAVACRKIIQDTEDSDFDYIMNTNMRGVFNCTRECVSDMIKNKCGVIVNISSVWGITGASCESIYSASKAAVIGFTKSLAKELGPSNIRVNCVAPGVIDTDMNKFLSFEEREDLSRNTLLERLGEPHEVADLVLFLAEDFSKFITGQVIPIDGGFAIQ